MYCTYKDDRTRGGGIARLAVGMLMSTATRQRMAYQNGGCASAVTLSRGPVWKLHTTSLCWYPGIGRAKCGTGSNSRRMGETTTKKHKVRSLEKSCHALSPFAMAKGRKKRASRGGELPQADAVVEPAEEAVGPAAARRSVRCKTSGPAKTAAEAAGEMLPQDDRARAAAEKETKRLLTLPGVEQRDILGVASACRSLCIAKTELLLAAGCNVKTKHG